MRIAFVINPLSSLSVKKDTTLALASAAFHLGCSVSFIESGDLSMTAGKPMGLARSVESISQDLQLVLSESVDSLSTYLTVSERHLVGADDIDLIFMRLDPPLDSAYWGVTYLLQAWERAGVRVANSTRVLREFNEKCSILLFPDLITDTIVGTGKDALHAFLEQHEVVILKPLNAMGGEGIQKLTVTDPGCKVQIQAATQLGKEPVMLQAVLPVEETGDRRILLFHGKPLPFVLARFPTGDDFRANIAVGGVGVAKPLTEEERALSAKVAARLPIDELGLIGLDVIGGCITEINVTSPTCLREIQTHSGELYAQAFIERYMVGV